MTVLYIGANRGHGNNVYGDLTISSGSSTGKDMEIAVDDSKGLTRNDVFLFLELLDQYFQDTSRTDINNI